MKFISDFFKGIFIGAGCILPGISSGVLCVVFGIYEKLLDSILNFFKDLKNNFKFLFPITLGGVVGVILFSNFLEYLLYKFPLQTKSIFVGFILGGVVLLLKNIKQKEKFKLTNLIYLLISMTIGILMVYFEENIGSRNVENISNIHLILSGFLMSIGIVVPGVSSTIILMLMGTYYTYLKSISILYLPILIPILIGGIIGSIIFMKIIKLLLDKYYIQTMYSIIGFSIGSIFVLMPEIYSTIQIIISVLSILLGYILIKLINN